MVSQSYYANVSAPILSYDKVYGQDEFYERCVAFVGFRCMEGTIVALCCEDGSHYFSTDLVKILLSVMKAGGLDVAHRLKVAEIILDTYRGEFDEKMNALVQVYESELEEKREELTTAFLGAGVNGRLIGVTVLGRDCAKNKNELLRYLQDSSKQVRERIIGICGEHEEWTEDILNILKNSKKSA